MQYSREQLEALWIRAGGDPAKARTAAAVALAESGGRSDAVNDKNTDGTIDRGLWQVNSIHGARSTTDPLANARAAVAISGNGRNWNPWVAFKNGSFRKFLTGAGDPDTLAPLTADQVAGGAEHADKLLDTPDSDGGIGGALRDIAAFFTGLTDPKTWLRVLQVVGGAVLIVAALAVLTKINPASAIPAGKVAKAARKL